MLRLLTGMIVFLGFLLTSVSRLRRDKYEKTQSTALIEDR